MGDFLCRSLGRSVRTSNQGLNHPSPHPRRISTLTVPALALQKQGGSAPTCPNGVPSLPSRRSRRGVGFCLLISSYLTSSKEAPIPTSSNSAHMLHTRSSPESRTQLNQSLAHSLAYNDSVRPTEVNGEFYWTTTFSMPPHLHLVAILLPGGARGGNQPPTGK